MRIGKYILDKRLPSAKLPLLGWSWDYPYWPPRYWRFANCSQLRFGWIVVSLNLPWIYTSARALHPEIIKEVERDYERRR